MAAGSTVLRTRPRPGGGAFTPAFRPGWHNGRRERGGSREKEPFVVLADAVARGLRREGYAVDIAYDGDEALDKATVNAYDLICLDITMPGRDGREVCRRLRSDPGLARQPRILMLTARDALTERVAG